MGHKRKDTYVVDINYGHLRPYYKRKASRKERQLAKQRIRKDYGISQATHIKDTDLEAGSLDGHDVHWMDTHG